MSTAESASHPQSRSRAFAAMGVLILVWSAVPLLLKHFTPYLDGWTVNGGRYALGMLWCIPYFLYRLARSEISPGIFRDAWIPAVCHVLGQICWGLAPYHNDAAIMHFIARTTFFFMIIFSFFLLHEERRVLVRPLFWLGAAGTVAGVYFMYIGAADRGSTSWIGVLLLLGAAAGWAGYGVTLKKCMSRHTAKLSFSVISLYAFPVLLVLMFSMGEWRALGDLSSLNWGLLALTGLASIVLAHILLFVVIQHFGPVISDGLLQVIPFLTLIGAYLWFDEFFSVQQWLGGGFLIAAAYVFLLVRR